MKKLLLFFVFVLITQVGCKITPVLAQQEQAIDEIVNVLRQFQNDIVNQDLNSALKHVSANYSVKAPDGTVQDYDWFKNYLESEMGRINKNLADYSIIDQELNVLKKEDNKFTVEYMFSDKGFNLNTQKEGIKRQKRIITLEKENGSWMITQWYKVKLPE